MPTLLALDPGETTGFSLWSYDAISPLMPLSHGQIPGGIDGFIDWWHASDMEYRADEVVSESFRLDGRTAYPNVTPLKIEGALAVLFPDFVLQPNTAKAHMRDEKIKALGLWWRGEGHAVDSLRHAFAYMKIRGHYPTVVVAFPPPKDADIIPFPVKAAA